MRGLRRAALALLVGVAACGGEGPGAAPQVGAAAPGYAAVSLGGDSVSLAKLRGKVVLLNVWATWCHPCREEIPALQQLHQAHAPRGLEVVRVSVDDRSEREGVRRFAGEFGVTYPIWLDPEERVSSTFRIIGVPSTYLIGRDGTVLWKHVGPVRADDPELLRLLDQALRAPGGTRDA